MEKLKPTDSYLTFGLFGFLTVIITLAFYKLLDCPFLLSLITGIGFSILIYILNVISIKLNYRKPVDITPDIHTKENQEVVEENISGILFEVLTQSEPITPEQDKEVRKKIIHELEKL